MRKKIVAITLDRNLLKILDQIPKETIPSRSLLIEKLIWKYLEKCNLAHSGSNGER